MTTTHLRPVTKDFDIPAEGGHIRIVSPCDFANVARVAAHAISGEVEQNHDIIMHPQTLASIRGFLDAAA